MGRRIAAQTNQSTGRRALKAGCRSRVSTANSAPFRRSHAPAVLLHSRPTHGGSHRQRASSGSRTDGYLPLRLASAASRDQPAASATIGGAARFLARHAT